MNKSSIQGFAAGIIFTVAVIGVYMFWSNENEGSSHVNNPPLSSSYELT
jgi:hypothetical protein